MASVEEFFRDIRHALRRLRHSAVFTSVVILTITARHRHQCGHLFDR